MDCIMTNTKDGLLKQAELIKKNFPVLKGKKNMPTKEIGKEINSLIDLLIPFVPNSIIPFPSKLEIYEGFGGYEGKTMRSYDDLKKDLDILISILKTVN